MAVWGRVAGGRPMKALSCASTSRLAARRKVGGVAHALAVGAVAARAHVRPRLPLDIRALRAGPTARNTAMRFFSWIPL